MQTPLLEVLDLIFQPHMGVAGRLSILQLPLQLLPFFQYLQRRIISMPTITDTGKSLQWVDLSGTAFWTASMRSRCSRKLTCAYLAGLTADEASFWERSTMRCRAAMVVFSCASFLAAASVALPADELGSKSPQST